MRVLGLTGDIACGKSSVAQMLAALGAAPLDADWLVRELYADRAFAARVQALFDTEILDANGAIDRAKLGAFIFCDAGKLRLLETLVHPAVAELRAQKLQKMKAAGERVATIEAVKLLESGQGAICDQIWCVVCAPDVQLARLMQKRGLSEAEARARLRFQPTRDAKLALAGAVPLVWIENNNSLDELRAVVARQWTRFLDDAA